MLSMDPCCAATKWRPFCLLELLALWTTFQAELVHCQLLDKISSAHPWRSTVTWQQEEEPKQYSAQLLLRPSQEVFQCTNDPSAQAQRSTVAQWQVGKLNGGLRGRDLSIHTLCVHVAAGSTSSALLLVEPGDIELQQPCISWAVRSNRIHFSPYKYGNIFAFFY